MKEQMMDIVLYVEPSTSLIVFMAWMHCVYTNSPAYLPVYFVVSIVGILLNNYFKYGVDEEFNCSFTPITISELFKVLLFGGPNTRYIQVGASQYYSQHASDIRAILQGLIIHYFSFSLLSYREEQIRQMAPKTKLVLTTVWRSSKTSFREV